MPLVPPRGVKAKAWFVPTPLLHLGNLEPVLPGIVWVRSRAGPLAPPHPTHPVPQQTPSRCPGCRVSGLAPGPTLLEPALPVTSRLQPVAPAPLPAQPGPPGSVLLLSSTSRPI